MTTVFRVWFGEEIVDNDWTVTALSHHLNVFDGTIEDWLAGRAVPARAECVRLAELFEVPAEIVLRFSGYTHDTK
ncbi:MAG: XRE family transcriptional regulator [Chloroflexota bacterium]|nr:MAG: XRE family transcriptional regulator [Chloroflexota bacterium]